jgi:MerR family transcriptional regulator, light-induced transcriptional regulator
MATSTYSIKDLEHLTGVKAHTLRIWEKRYQVVTPSRTSTNIRYYTDEDLKKLLNISILNRHGFKISSIANLPNSELSQKIISISNKTFDSNSKVESLIIAMIEMNEVKFEKDLSNMILNLGFENTFNQVLIPFFEKVGLLWQIGTIYPGQEHFMTNLIRQKMIVAIDGLVSEETPKIRRTFVLYLPDGELHEIGLLYYSYIIQKMGHKVIYLGQMVPFDDLVQIAEKHNPDGFVAFITSSLSNENINEHLSKLALHFSGRKILVSGLQFKINDLQLPEEVTLITNTTELKREIRSI